MQSIADLTVRGQFTIDGAVREIDRRADRLLEKRRWMMERRA
jgi:multiple sugar transport system substrate-binding protein